MRFSRRLPADLSASPFAQALTRRRASGASLLDLTVSNPTAVGLPTPHAVAADEVERLYEPHPLGSPAARQAVAAYWAERGVAIPADQIVLTASTSEAYAHLFRALADPGENVLAPRPSYPLFEPLAELEGVRLKPYPLRLGDDGLWRPDLDVLQQALDAETRGVLVVHPNNPTGSLWRAEDRQRLASLCAERQVAIVADEVFGDFVYEAGAESPVSCRATWAGGRSALTFVLGGLSKTCGAPHVKLAWTVVVGPETDVGEARRRLEWIGDAFLSVSAAAQAAAPRLLGERHGFVAATRARVLANCELLGATLAAPAACRALPVEGGWTAMLQLPPGWDEERAATRLLEAGVLVQPGYFFDCPEEGYLAVSLLTPPRVFGDGARVLAAYLK